VVPEVGLGSGRVFRVLKQLTEDFDIGEASSLVMRLLLSVADSSISEAQDGTPAL
jgi:hypothetical protein